MPTPARGAPLPLSRGGDTRPTPLRDSPFAFTRPARKRGLFDRIFERGRPDLAMQALQHLLARRDPRSISQTEISDLLIEYGLDSRDARRVLVTMWRRVLEIFLADNEFSDRETQYLEQLRDSLALTDAEIAEVDRAVIHPRYEVAVKGALSDARLSDEERAALERLARRLRLPEDIQRDIYERTARRALQTKLRQSVEDRRLSPAELEELTEIARHLGVDRRFEPSTEALLDRFALLWRIENGDIPEIAATVPLTASEHCHFEAPAAWHAPRATSGSDAEGIGPVRIARGVYYRSGSVSTELLRSQLLAKVADGKLVITSRAVIFDGGKHHVTLPLRKLESFQVWGDGLTLEKDGAPVGHLLIDGDAELAAVILGAALARA